jgi:hypothetical protein
MFPRMGFNQSDRQKRSAVLRMTLAELAGFCLTVDCRTPGCRGERTYSVGDIAGLYGKDLTMAEALRRMRCACGSAPARASLVTWPPRKLKVDLI